MQTWGLQRMELCPNISAVVPSDQDGQAFAKALDGAEYAIHCVPVQHSRNFLVNIKVVAISSNCLRFAKRIIFQT